MAENFSPRRRLRASERLVLRSLLYVVMIVSGLLLLLRYVVRVGYFYLTVPDLPRISPEKNPEVYALSMTVRFGLDQSTLLLLFVLAMGFLAATSRPEPPT